LEASKIWDDNNILGRVLCFEEGVFYSSVVAKVTVPFVAFTHSLPSNLLFLTIRDM